MYANTVQKTQKSYFLIHLMFPKEAMAKDCYDKQEFDSEKRTVLIRFTEWTMKIRTKYTKNL
jgi:hypothetical protein